MSSSRPAARTLAAWALWSASSAPLSLLLGLGLGALRQDARFDSTVDTISDLAATYARDRWIMTSALWVLGLCHIATALGLREALWPGRLLLGIGGISTILVAIYPLTSEGMSGAHALTALAAFVSMCAWPLLAIRMQIDSRSLLRARPALLASAVLFSLLAWFDHAVDVRNNLGLSERALAIAQAFWPLAVVLRSRE